MELSKLLFQRFIDNVPTDSKFEKCYREYLRTLGKVIIDELPAFLKGKSHDQ